MRFVAPVMRVRLLYNRGRLRTHFGFEREWISLQRQHAAILPGDFIFVSESCANIRQENFPDARRISQPHHMAAAVPKIEVADHRDALGIGSPDSKMHASRTFMLNQMGAHFVKQPQMRAFSNVVIVHGAKHRPKCVGVRHMPFAAMIAGPVAQWLAGLKRDRAFKKSCRMPLP